MVGGGWSRGFACWAVGELKRGAAAQAEGGGAATRKGEIIRNPGGEETRRRQKILLKMRDSWVLQGYHHDASATFALELLQIVVYVKDGRGQKCFLHCRAGRL